ncbi:MAG: RNA polymerase factor sigma-54 [Clostridiales bacterium]
MNISLTQKPIQSQKIILSQGMINYLKILQMSNLDLKEYTDKVLNTNPMLDTKNNDVLENYIENFDNNYYNLKSNNYSYSDSIITQKQVTPNNLKEYLFMQISEINIPYKLKPIAIYIIESIDNNGYLIDTIENISDNFLTPIDQVKNCLKLIQNMDPAGVASRSLKESIYIQLKRKNSINNDMINFIIKNLNLLAKKSYSKLLKISGVKRSYINEALSILKTISPKPGQNFCSSQEEIYVYPDIIIHKSENKYKSQFSQENELNLIINNYYRNLIKNENCNEELSEFFRKKLSEAIDLIKMIEKRKYTILKISDFIINYQKDFLDKGFEHLKPLTMNIVAKNLDLHESTISRTVNKKFIQTSRGMFKLKFFFSSNSNHSDNNLVATTSIKNIIKNTLSEENKKKPLSDEKIKAILESKNIKIARRTVAKYRNELGIISSSSRKI